MSLIKQRIIILIIFFLVYPLLKVDAQESVDKWTKISGPFGGNIKNLFNDTKGNLYAATDVGIFISKDSSKSWEETGFQGEFNWITKNQFDELIVMSDARYILKSSNQGNTWKHSINGLPSSIGYNMTFFIDGTRILVFPQKGGIYESTDEGASWNYLNDINVWLNSVIKLNPTTLFATSQDGIYLSYDNGYTWNGPNKALGEGLGKISIDKNGILYINARTKILISSNNGISWYPTQNIPFREYNNVDCLNVDIPGTLIATSFFDNVVHFSMDGGDTWEKKEISKYMFEINDICTLNNRIFIATSEGILTLSNFADSISSCNNGITAIDSEELIVDNHSNIYLRTDTKIFKSTDKGISWNELNVGFSFRDPFELRKLAVDLNGNLYCTNFYDLYIYSDNGWILKPNYSLSDPYEYIVLNKANEMISSRYGLPGIFISKDGGSTWIRIDDTQIPHSTKYLYIDDRDYIYVCTEEGVYYTPDMGGIWGKLKNLPSENAQIIYKLPSTQTLLVGTKAGLYISNDEGVTWSLSEQHNAVNNNYYYLFRDSKNLLYLASEAYEGIKVSSDNGQTWNDFSKGFGYNIVLNDGTFHGNLSQKISSIVEIDDILYASTNSGLFRYGSSPSSVDYLAEKISNNYKLFQNYPNPFNPNTSISFSLPQKSFTSLKVFDILGKEVKVLVSDLLSEGYYSYNFDGNNLSSGLYIYQLSTNMGIVSRKMLLMK